MKPFTLIALLLCYFSPQAQEPAFGKIDIEDLKLKSCAFEPGADAMVLLDLTEVKFEIGGSGYSKMIIDRRVRIKIFNQKGTKRADINIPYLYRKNRTRVTDISGITYNLGVSGNVEINKIEKDQIFKNKTEDNVRALAFTFPNVKPGSVIEYRYTRVEKRSAYFDPWLLQASIPTRYSVYKINNLLSGEIIHRKRTQIPIHDSTRIIEDGSFSSEKRMQFFAVDIPSFKAEPYMGSYKDNLQRVEFAYKRNSIFNTILSDERQWELINELFYGRYAGVEIKSETIKPFIDSVKKIEALDEKVGYVFRQTKKTIAWDEEQTFQADDVEECWKTKTGNSAQINIIMMYVLRKAGVPCYPLLISTRDNGKIDRTFADYGQFNGVDILVLDTVANTNYVLDATVKYGSYKTPPYNILNREALLVDKEKGRWVLVGDTRQLIKESISALAKLDSGNIIKGEVATSLADYSKDIYLERKNRKEDEKDDEEFVDNAVQVQFSNYSEENADDEKKPLVQKFEFRFEAPGTGDYIYFKPSVLTELRKNPFISEKRQWDMDFGSGQDYFIAITLRIPENMVYESMPRNITLRNSDSTLIFKRVSLFEGNTSSCRMYLEVRKALFGKEEYEDVRSFYKKLFDLLEEHIVIRKKE